MMIAARTLYDRKEYRISPAAEVCLRQLAATCGLSFTDIIFAAMQPEHLIRLSFPPGPWREKGFYASFPRALSVRVDPGLHAGLKAHSRNVRRSISKVISAAITALSFDEAWGLKNEPVEITDQVAHASCDRLSVRVDPSEIPHDHSKPCVEFWECVRKRTDGDEYIRTHADPALVQD